MASLAVGYCLQPLYQIRSKYMQYYPSYGPKCEFQYGGRGHLEFCRIWVLTVKTVPGHHFQFLCQIWCESGQSDFELWPFNWFQDGSRLEFTSGVNFIIWSFLQRVSIACYAERCISHSKSVRPSVRPSVCLTVRLSHAGTESKPLKLRSWGLHWRIAPWL